MAVKGVVDLQAHGDAIFIFVGLGLFVAGVTAFLINRAGERRAR